MDFTEKSQYFIGKHIRNGLISVLKTQNLIATFRCILGIKTGVRSHGFKEDALSPILYSFYFKYARNWTVHQHVSVVRAFGASRDACLCDQ